MKLTYALLTAFMAVFLCAFSPVSSPANSPAVSPVPSVSIEVEENEYLDSVISSTVFDLDATVSDSYSGSGTKWANLTESPADGSSKTAYDFTNSGFVFTGLAGDTAAYWLSDGNDIMTLASGANTTFLKNLHKTSGGQAFWFAVAWRSATADTAGEGLFTTAQTTTGAGMRLQHTAAEAVNLTQRGDSTTATVTHTSTLAGSTDHIVIWSAAAGSGSASTVRIWVDSATAESFTPTYNSSSTDASGVATLGAILGDGSFKLNSGVRVYAAAAGNELIDNTKAAAIIAHLEARHGRDYTP